ncbi:MAG: permease [Candidatus Omnitrophica bacterium]|nr:permease [Candidatus Omnitrophota bacterium]
MFLSDFLSYSWSYTLEIMPPLLLGFLASGVIHEFLPTSWVQKHLGGKGIKPLFYSTVVGTVMPVCCWGSLPVAVSFYKKGSSLGTIFAFLVATPATSLTALFVTWKFFGLGFMLYVAFAVITMGLMTGLIGNQVSVPKKEPSQQKHEEGECCACETCETQKPWKKKIQGVFYYALIEMPREIGKEVILGIVLAALVSSLGFVGDWIHSYLAGNFAYLFTVVFGLTVYLCSTMSVPLIHAFITQGMNAGAGLALLILGPIASFGTMLVLRKEFGLKVLILFLSSVTFFSLAAGILYEIFR